MLLLAPVINAVFICTCLTAKVAPRAKGVNGRIQDLMVIFTDCGPEADGCFAGEAFEEAVEIGRIPESQAVSDLFDGQVGVKKHSFGFQDDPFLDERCGCPAGLFPDRVVEMSRRHVEQPGIVRYLVQGVISFIYKLVHPAHQPLAAGGSQRCGELAGIEAAEVDQEDLQVRLKHAFFPVPLLCKFAKHLGEQVVEEGQICFRQFQFMAIIGILQDGELFPAALFLGQEELFRKGQEGATDGGISFFKVHLVREGEIKVPCADLMAYKIYPVPVAPFFGKEEKVIIFPVGHEQMVADPGPGAVQLFNLKNGISVLTGLFQRVMRDDRFLPGLVHGVIVI